MQRRGVCGLVLVLIMAGACVSGPGKRYHNRDKKFSIMIPHNWETLENTRGALLAAASPRSGGQGNDPGRAMLAVTWTPSPRGYGLEMFFMMTLDNLKKHRPGFRSTRQRWVRLGGRDARHVSYQHVVGGIPVQAELYMVRGSGGIFSLTLAAGVARYDRFQGLLRQVADSFRVE